MSDTASVAPGVTRGEWACGYYLLGAKDDLLRAGLAKPEWFLDGQKRNTRGNVIRQVETTHEGRYVTCSQPAKGLCFVRFTYVDNDGCAVANERFDTCGAKTQAMGAMAYESSGNHTLH